jgi:transposase-like protein
MEFPILELMGHDESTGWVEKYLHPNGLNCPKCGTGKEHGRVFRQTRQSRLTVYRCRCGATYNLYTGTVLAQHHLTPAQVVLLLRGILKGETTAALSRELGVGYEAVLNLRHERQAHAERLQPQDALPDTETESDERFQNAGDKRQAAS